MWTVFRARQSVLLLQQLYEHHHSHVFLGVLHHFPELLQNKHNRADCASYKRDSKLTVIV